MDSRDGLVSFDFLFTAKALSPGKLRNRISATLFPHKSCLLDQAPILVSSKKCKDAVNFQPKWQHNPGDIVDVFPNGIEVPGSRCPDGI